MIINYVCGFVCRVGFDVGMQIIIVIVVVFAGVFEVDVSNWSPFMPNGFKAVVTGSTVVFFAYVGFDAVANSAEEAKNPQVILLLFPYYHLKYSLCSLL